MNAAVVCKEPPPIAEPGKGGISPPCSLPQASLSGLRYVILTY
jgi:hypothetical protein